MESFIFSTPIHSYCSYLIAKAIFEKKPSDCFSAMSRCPSNLKHLASIAGQLSPEYSTDMTLNIKWTSYYSSKRPDMSSDDICKSFAVAMMLYAACEIDRQQLSKTPTTFEDIARGKSDLSLTFICSQGTVTIRVSDIALIASIIAGFDLSRWTSDEIAAAAGESLNPVEYEVLAAVITDIATANEELENKTKQLEAEHQAKLKALQVMTNSVKKSIYNVAASALKKNLAYANVEAMVNMFVLS